MLGNKKTSKPVAGAKEAKKSKSGTQINKDQNVGKRQGESLQDPTQKRRAAFGDLTNALADKTNPKKVVMKCKVFEKKPLITLPKPAKESKIPQKEKKPRSTLPKVTPRETVTDESVLPVVTSLLGSANSGSHESLSSTIQESAVPESDSCQTVEYIVLLAEEKDVELESKPKDVDDVDTENLNNPIEVALYARDIFQYYMQRELLFKVDPYLSSQRYLTSSMRAILVDWLVEVQENFELNHETLYLAVKLVDIYLSNEHHIPKEMLQLIGAVSMFISSKFDERFPPLVEDFLYICDDAYKRKQFLDMERNILITIGFDIGIPLSYRFLRRYAKCCRVSMETLTLARYILEMSLMEYDFIPKHESTMAAASLWLALRMNKISDWTNSLKYHTGYQVEDFIGVAKQLNTYVSNPPKQLTTIRSKYSHKVFYEVAKVASLPDTEFV